MYIDPSETYYSLMVPMFLRDIEKEYGEATPELRKTHVTIRKLDEFGRAMCYVYIVK